jgi:lipopolysaccharide biosynthesis glycosyltransferase
MENRPIPIVFCVDKNALIGLHVSLFSLLRHLQPNAEVVLYILTDSLDEGDLAALRATIDRSQRTARLVKVDIDVQQFKDFSWLTGYMTYARLLLPSLIDDARALYLDADLIVTADIAQLFRQDLQGFPLGAVVSDTVRSSNDRDFFLRLGFPETAPYFNAGVLLLDLERLRRENYLKKCLAFAREYKTQLPTADQTILNYVFRDNYLSMPYEYNTPIFPTQKLAMEKMTPGRIYHLVGFPKPWDFLGEWFNQQSPFFQIYLRQTAAIGYKSYHRINTEKIYRTVRKFRSYQKCARALLR